MRNVIRRLGRLGVAAGSICVLAGCGLSGLGGTPGPAAPSPAQTIHPEVAASALVAVTDGPAAGPALAGLVAATARPNEALRVVQAGTPARSIVASDAPGPATVVIPGPPAPGEKGQTAYQAAQSASKLKTWQAMKTAKVKAEAEQTQRQTSAWAAGQQIAQKMRQQPATTGAEGSLAAESAVAASVQAGLEEGAGGALGSRRVIVLFCDTLDSSLPAGELTGDDVIVVMNSLPTAAQASAAQAALLHAGAADATVTGPEMTAAQRAALVTAGLSQGAGPGEEVSAPVLFGNDSAALDTAAVAVLAGLLPRLQEPGATAVISGFASTPGTAEANYALSYDRATAVAGYFEARGVAGSALIIVGHGTSDPVGSGASADNRRVLVVIEKPAG